MCRLLYSRQWCKLYNEGGKCNMWTSGYLFDLSKTKNIYTFVVQEKYLNKNDFLLPWENKYNVQVWSSGQLRSKEFEKNHWF